MSRTAGRITCSHRYSRAVVMSYGTYCFSSQTRVAVVIEDSDRYRGMLTLDDLAEGITT